MSDPTLETQIDAARVYENLFVRALFGPWASVVADAAELRPGARVLDVACGTGVLAREASSRVGAGGFAAGVDPNRGMLTVAGQLAPAVEWREAVAESLPYPDRSFDAVVSQFGLTFFSDCRRAIEEMLRVLTPQGRLAVAVWDAVENLQAYAAEVELLEREAGRRAADALRAPFVFGDPHALAALFEDAGAAEVEVTTRKGTAEFPSVRSMVEADLRGWLPVMGVELPEEQIGRILEQAETVLSGYVTSQGTVVFETRAHVVTASAK